MFDYTRWKNAAPALLKSTLKAEVAEFKKSCPEPNKIDNSVQLDAARGAAGKLLKAVKDVQAKLAKKKSGDQGATDLMKEWNTKLTAYLKALVAREKALIASVNADRKKDIQAGEKIVKSIKANMQAVVTNYNMAAKIMVAAAGLMAKNQDKKAINLTYKAFGPILQQMQKAGNAANKTFQSNKDALSVEQREKVESWLNKGGVYSQMATAVSHVIRSIKDKGSLGVTDSDRKKLFGKKFAL